MNPVITAKDLVLHMNKQLLFDHISFNILEKQVVGLVGKNGAGKTTLLRILAEEGDYDGGEVTHPQGTNIGYLPQDFEMDLTKTVWEIIDSNDDNQHYAKQLLKDLNIEQFKDTKTSELSGGQKRKAALAKALLNQPDLLILDEPTNHLDLETIQHLEDLIRVYDGAVLIVSHDRYFLDKVCTNMLELFDRKMYSHNGNYSHYLKQREKRWTNLEAQDARRHQLLKKEKEWVGQGVKARETKNKGRLKSYYELDSIEDFRRPKPLEFILPPTSPLGNKILNIKSLVLGYDDTVLIDKMDLKIEEGMKIGLIGPNGAGKSTLMKTITGENTDHKGTVKSGDNTVYNYLDQEKAQLNPEYSVFETIAEGKENLFFGGSKINVRAYLKRFLFETPGDWKKIVRQLSGGEKTRLLLAKMFKRGGNFLLLDEPTNDLDITTLEALENTLNNFKGCSVITSHDRYFLDKVCDHILCIQGNGNWLFSHGNYSRFVSKYGTGYGIDVVAAPTESKPKASPEEQRKEKKLKYLRTRQMNKIEGQIEELQKEILEFEHKFNDAAFYERNKEKMSKLAEKLKEMKHQLETKEEKWLQLSMM